MTEEKLYTREEVNKIIDKKNNDFKEVVERLKEKFVEGEKQAIEFTIEFSGTAIILDYNKIIDEIFGDLK